MHAPDEPWRNAGLLFGRMFEDWTIERRVFPPSGRLLCIASAGCTALNLAALGREIVAVDVNAAQIDAVKARLNGAKASDGSVDRLLSRARLAFPAIGWSRQTVQEFLALDDPKAQRALWRASLDTRRWRLALAAVLNPMTLRAFFPSSLAAAVPPGFAAVVRRRLDEAGRPILIGRTPGRRGSFSVSGQAPPNHLRRPVALGSSTPTRRRISRRVPPGRSVASRCRIFSTLRRRSTRRGYVRPCGAHRRQARCWFYAASPSRARPRRPPGPGAIARTFGAELSWSNCDAGEARALHC